MAGEHHKRHQAYNLVPSGHPVAGPPDDQRPTGAGAALAPIELDESEAGPLVLPGEAFQAEAGAPLVRCIAPPRLDGHTRARFELAPSTLLDDALVVELVELFGDRERLRKEKNARGAIVRQLPTGHYAECNVTGTRRHMLSFYVWDRVFISVNLETGELKLQWKARELWEHGARAAVESWCSAVSRWLDGVCDLDVTQLHVCGWTMTGLEICADFVHLNFTRADVEAFMGRFGKSDVAVSQGDRFGDVQTIQLGSRRSNVSLCIYDKTAQIRDAKDGKNLPTYAATWERQGWCGEEVTRVELRLAKRGLEWKTDAGVVNLRDPAIATDPVVLRNVWASLLGTRYRLVEQGTASRARRCRMDPRWQMVVEAAQVAEVVKLEQDRREVEDAYAEKLGRATRDATKALVRVAALHGVERFSERSELATAADIAVVAAARQGLDIDGYADAYSKLVRETLADEINDARERWRSMREPLTRRR